MNQTQKQNKTDFTLFVSNTICKTVLTVDTFVSSVLSVIVLTACWVFGLPIVLLCKFSNSFLNQKDGDFTRFPNSNCDSVLKTFKHSQNLSNSFTKLLSDLPELSVPDYDLSHFFINMCSIAYSYQPDMKDVCLHDKTLKQWGFKTNIGGCFDGATYTLSSRTEHGQQIVVISFKGIYYIFNKNRIKKISKRTCIGNQIDYVYLLEEIKLNINIC